LVHVNSSCHPLAESSPHMGVNRKITAAIQ
jgi:hypothetical protein